MTDQVRQQALLAPEVKQALSATIRALRERLLRDLGDEAERRYQLSVPLGQAGLDEAHRRRRQRLEAYLDERVRAARPKNDAERKAARARLLGQAVKEAGATLLNRLVLLRQLEALGLAKPKVVTGGWTSPGYQEFRDFAPALLDDEAEGYATLLGILFDDLAVELPGLFGPVGVTELLPVPSATLREVVQRLDAKELESAWTDDTTLGWIYQYWNDPEREALDAKINDGGKIEPHEIAAKTQMFTERYMVEWLLQNSLGLTWLCICKKNGWTADAERVLPVLEARRADWRQEREAGAVALDALMPIRDELEDAWKYYVPQPIPEDAVAKAPDSLRELKLLDPACGSGHFLVIAFDLLARLHREEGRHRGEMVTDAEIAEAILARNLHGIDIDPRAVQIAAAALYLKAKTLAPEARLGRVNLVAPALELANLPDDDPSLVELRAELKREAGISEELTRRLVSSLAGVDHLGTLLKVDAAVEEALREQDARLRQASQRSFVFASDDPEETVLVEGTGPTSLVFEDRKATVLDKLERFLATHSTAEDLGLRLDGEQLAAGVRFVRMVREGTYDVVVGNPPYQGLSKTALSDYVAKKYPRGKADLYAAFLERGVELARDGGLSALLTMRGWMFLGQFSDLRKALLPHVVTIVDLHFGAFSTMKDVSVCMSLCSGGVGCGGSRRGTALRPVPPENVVRDAQQPMRNQSGLTVLSGRYEFDPKGFEVIEGEPIVYWWSKEFLERYAKAPKLGEVAPVRQGMPTSNNARHLRLPWELPWGPVVQPALRCATTIASRAGASWVPYIKGAAGRAWSEPVDDLVRWTKSGLEIKIASEHAYGSVSKRVQSEEWYFVLGVAFAMIGAQFSARVHRVASIFGHMGSSVFPPSAGERSTIVCLMNSSLAKMVLSGLNPGIHFEVGDVNRLPVFVVANAEAIVSTVDTAFTAHESAREPSVEFRRPGPSPWRYAQDWAQRAVDRPEGAPLPPYEPEVDPPEPEADLSFALGVALGRFRADGAGLCDGTEPAPLPQGLLFVSPSENAPSTEPGAAPGLWSPACAPLREAWQARPLGGRRTLGEYLRLDFFGYHKKLYENRPIYLPFSSSKKSYVAFASIHRWRDDTLSNLLADYLVPEKRRLEGEIEDLRATRQQSTDKTKSERRFAEAQKLLAELSDFIVRVTEIAEQGPPPPDAKVPRREVDARFAMDLDDGVMVNSAALWPLLEPQWKDPKKWWSELATAKGRKDYDWAHLAARYFPTRVRQKCVEDPSLAVAHRCFWELHPAQGPCLGAAPPGRDPARLHHRRARLRRRPRPLPPRPPRRGPRGRGRRAETPRPQGRQGRRGRRRTPVRPGRGGRGGRRCLRLRNCC